MGDTVLFAREHSYVQTLRGRRRYLRDILSRNHAARAAAERVAINAPIQGSAADMIKLAMLDIQRELDRRAAAARMILQVHDELVFEVPTAQLAEVSAVVTAGMRDAMPLGQVPVVVDVGVGDNCWRRIDSAVAGYTRPSGSSSRSASSLAELKSERHASRVLTCAMRSGRG